MPTPLTVEFIGSRVDPADAITNYTATKIAGGGASPGEQSSSLFQQGVGAVATDYPTASRFVTLLYDIVGAGGTALDFSPGGAQENQLLWVWGNALLPLTSTGTNTAGAIGGMGIYITDTLNPGSSYAGWTFYGAENYPGGFQKMVVDVTKRPTFSGAFSPADLAAVRQVGIFFISDNLAKGGADAAIVDAIDIGSGLRIFGSGTPDAGFLDLIDADEGTIANQYGVIKSLDAASNIVELQGVLEIGSGVNATTYFDDINRVVNFASPQYLGTANSPNDEFVNSIPDDFQKIKAIGNSTSGTFINLGEKVGDGDTARGRNGLTILGNEDYSISYEFDDGNVDDHNIYGTTIRNFNGTLNWPAVSGHEFIGSIIDGSSQFNAASGVEIRNSTFQNYTGLDGSFLYNTGTNIKNSSFIANANLVGSGAAIEHTFSGTFIYDNLQFSANDFDINFSSSTSGTLLIQAANGSNPGSATSGNADSQVIIENTVVLTLTDIVVGSEVRIYKSDPTGVFPEELAGIETEDDGIFEYAYNFTGDFDVDIVCLKLEYDYFRTNNNTLVSTPNTIKINQVFDRNYENP